MEIALWSTTEHVVGSAVRGVIVYGFALAAVRLAGRRTLAQLSAFDTVVTIALGSIAAATAVPANASVADGVAVLLAFVVVQSVLGAARQRSRLLRRLTDFPPEVVVRDGVPQLSRSPFSAQMTAEELVGKLRASGVVDIDAVTRGILESGGSISATTGAPGGTLFDDDPTASIPQR